MREVVVFGGGLTGLAATYELQKHKIATTLIEVKPRLGGGIITAEVNGFRFDGGAMTHEINDPAMFEAYLAELGLGDSAFATDEGQLAFAQGTGQLIDALAARLHAPMMMRMAVSTLGTMGDGLFSICMENGMVLDAHALIVAVPARYAERMFYTLTPEISHQLFDYRYDTITRLSLGYADMSALRLTPPPDSPLTTIAQVQGTPRTPDENGAILQVAIRVAPHDLPPDPVGEVAALMGWPLNPDADFIHTWTESDPTMWRSAEHSRRMALIQSLLPPGVALAGSDYIPAAHAPTLDERVAAGIQAARRVMAVLR